MTQDSEAVRVEQCDREAAILLLDQQGIRLHRDGTFRDWDNTVQAFARHRRDGMLAAAEICEKRAAAFQVGKDRWPDDGVGAFDDGLRLCQTLASQIRSAALGETA